MRAQAPEFPMLAIIVSGGHSQLVLFQDHFKYHYWGALRTTRLVEAFDKVAKLTGLPYPGGPSVSKAALLTVIQMPSRRLKPTLGDFSFSGPKTAVLRAAQAMCGQDFSFPSYKLPERLTDQQVADIAASFQTRSM